MLTRKTNLSSITKNLFNNDYDQETLFASPLKTSDRSLTKLSQNFSPSKFDSIDNLLDNQPKSHRPQEFNLKKMLSRMDNNDYNTEIKPQPKTFRFRRHEFQSVPTLKLEIKNDVEDFFNNNDTPQKSQIHTQQEKKIYKLVTFTDYVENIYGKDWFVTAQRRMRRQTTIQEFFDVLD